MTTNTSKKAASAINTDGLHANTNGGNFRTCSGVRQVPDAKAVSTLKARLSQAGHVVHQTNEGGFLVCKYGMSYFAKDCAALQDFARKLGVNP